MLTIRAINTDGLCIKAPYNPSIISLRTSFKLNGIQGTLKWLVQVREREVKFSGFIAQIGNIHYTHLHFFFFRQIVQSIPDTMSAFLSPALGYMTDRVGHRGHQLLISGAVISLAHLTLGFTFITPIAPLFFLGIFYASFGSALWPSFALVVEHYHLGTAYGIATVALNIGLSVVPIIVGRIRAISTFAHVELFFAMMAAAGTLASVGLLIVGTREGSPLEKVHVDEQLINSPKDGGLTTRWVTEGKSYIHFGNMKSSTILIPYSMYALGHHAIVPHRYSTTSWVDDTGAIHHVIGSTNASINVPPTSDISVI